jgi:DNA-directed RNA polymerase subunit RPC12/RpoP
MVVRKSQNAYPAPTMIQFRCPNCDKRLHADAKLAGSAVTCTLCHSTILVPVVPVATNPVFVQPPTPAPVGETVTANDEPPSEGGRGSVITLAVLVAAAAIIVLLLSGGAKEHASDSGATIPMSAWRTLEGR